MQLFIIDNRYFSQTTYDGAMIILMSMLHTNSITYINSGNLNEMKESIQRILINYNTIIVCDKKIFNVYELLPLYKRPIKQILKSADVNVMYINSSMNKCIC